ncbi:MAG: 4-carboxy-4-hydroxy-2-oxoadipate aldolase/oxaloacetate decarboxylase [Thermodesulfobacteriota bacterium]
MDPHVIKDIPRPSPHLIRKLTSFETATVHEASGGKGALTSDIKPIDRNSRLYGPSLTVFCRPGDNLIIHKAIYVAEPGDVLVVTAGGYVEAGPWGEIMTIAAQARGIAGLIIDGSVRDSSFIIESKFPVFSRGLSIKGTSKECLGLINYPICIGGVTIHPGDVVLGDADGVVVVAYQDLPIVLEKCKLRKEKEEKIKQELKMGKSTLELYGFDQILQTKGLKEA